MTGREIAEAARFAQGGDTYPGIDKFRIRTLPAGSRLVKLEPSGSGFFIPWHEYLRFRRNSSELSKAYQIAPRNCRDLANSKNAYDYRSRASLFITVREIQVAHGTVKSNPQYGSGNFEQIFIADYKMDDILNHSNLGIRKVHDLSLSHTSLDSVSGDAIFIKEKIYSHIRNYHAYLSQQESLRKLYGQITIPSQKLIYDHKLTELKKICELYKKRIERNICHFHQLYPDLSPPRAPTYERAIRYQEQLARAEKLGLEMVPHPRLERESRQLRQHLIAKVDDTVRKVVGGAWKPEECDREIRIDNLRRLYETDQFIKRSQCLQQIADQNARIRELELAIDRIDKREKELLAMGKLNHVLDDRRPALRHELDSAQALCGTLKNELTSLESRRHDYQTFLAMSGKTREISGFSLSG